MMVAKEELLRLVDLLSDYECQHLLRTVRNVEDGEPYWEGDVGVLYNEEVKLRSFNLSEDTAALVPSFPVSGDGVFAPIPIVKSFVDSERVALPAPEPLPGSLAATLAGRRSRRDYTTDPVSLGTLSTFLAASVGVTGLTFGYGYRRLALRSFPSAGGLQGPEVYVVAFAVDGLEAGVYHYQPMEHVLERLDRDIGPDRLSAVALAQPYVAQSAFVVILTGSYERLRWKYGERAYRYLCMDAGGATQNLYLAAEALGLGACAIAGFVDDAVEDLLGIDGVNELALLLLTVGSIEPAE